MKKFLTILLLASALFAIVEENQAAPDVLESQKSGITITTDKGQAIKINTDGPVPVVTHSSHRFSRKNVGLSQPNRFVSRRKMGDDQGADEEENTPSEQAQEDELIEAVKLVGKLKRERKNQDGDTVTLDGSLVDEIIEKLEGYEDTLQEIIAENEAESSSSSSSSSTTNGARVHHNHTRNEENVHEGDWRKRNLKVAGHHRFSHFRHSRVSRVAHKNKWVIKP